MSPMREGEIREIGTFLTVRLLPQLPKQVTCRWEVLNRDGIVLGQVRFHTGWRKYIFAPEESTIFDHNCLVDIIKFLADIKDVRVGTPEGATNV